MSSNAKRKSILSHYRKIGTLTDTKAYADPTRRYAPYDGLSIALAIRAADSTEFPVRNLSELSAHPVLGPICSGYQEPALDVDDPWVGCLLLDHNWSASRILHRGNVQLQAFEDVKSGNGKTLPHGLIAVPASGDFIDVDGGNDAKLLAVTMTTETEDGVEYVKSKLHWQLRTGKLEVDSWRWPDKD